MLARFATPYSPRGHYFFVVFSPQRPQAQVGNCLTAPKIIEYNFGAYINIRVYPYIYISIIDNDSVTFHVNML
jgi:hypothetical protein